MYTLDLGCGAEKKGDIGIDIAPAPGVDHVLRLGFDPIPYPENTFDAAVMIHAIEHIPFTVYAPVGSRGYPVTQLLREVCRVLKPGGVFRILTLEYPDSRCFEDPTHVSVWTRDTIRHFVGARDSETGNANDERAGLRVRGFTLLRSGPTSDGLLEITLQKDPLP